MLPEDRTLRLSYSFRLSSSSCAVPGTTSLHNYGGGVCVCECVFVAARAQLLGLERLG